MRRIWSSDQDLVTPIYPAMFKGTVAQGFISPTQDNLSTKGSGSQNGGCNTLGGLATSFQEGLQKVGATILAPGAIIFQAWLKGLDARFHVP